jgi:hypothetical protein
LVLEVQEVTKILELRGLTVLLIQLLPLEAVSAVEILQELAALAVVAIMVVVKAVVETKVIILLPKDLMVVMVLASIHIMALAEVVRLRQEQTVVWPLVLPLVVLVQQMITVQVQM